MTDATTVPTPINYDDQIRANQAAAAKLGIKLPGVGERPTIQSGAQDTENAANAAKVQNQGKAGYDIFGNPLSSANAQTTADTVKAQRDAGGTYTSMDGTVHYNYDGSVVNNASSNSGAAPQSSFTNDQAGIDAAQQKILQDKAQAVADAQQFATTQQNILNGTIPLTAGQQAQIAGLQQQYQQLIDQQTLMNTGATGTANIRGYQTGAAEYDPTFQAKTINAIASAGASKIANLQTELASNVAKLTSAFQQDDIASVKLSYDAIKTARDDYDSELQSYTENVQKAIKAAQDQVQQKLENARQAAQDTYNQVTKPINDVAADAAKNGADEKTLAAINAAKTPSDAIAAAGGFLQTATGDLGDYINYKRQAAIAGTTPETFDAWKDAKDAHDIKNAAAKAYATSYATESAKSQFVNSSSNQQKLEQQYRTVLVKELSNRTGGLGLQDAKVNQAIHLKALYDQYLDPKTGNYNVPTAQYYEMVLGLANLLSPTGNTSEADRQDLKSKTAAGDLKGALQYITGVPQNGNTQQIIKNLVDSINRQGSVAEQERDTDVQFLRGLVPTDLNPDRVAALEKNSLNSFINPKNDPVIQQGVDAKKSVNEFITKYPSAVNTIAKLYVPGVSDADVLEYIGMHPELAK